jgi:hypothetical protein
VHVCICHWLSRNEIDLIYCDVWGDKWHCTNWIKARSVRRGRCKERHEISVACWDRATHQFSIFLNPDSEHSMLSDSFQVFLVLKQINSWLLLFIYFQYQYLFYTALHGISYIISAVLTRACMVNWIWSAGAAATATTKYNRRHGQQKWPTCMIPVVLSNWLVIHYI